MTVGSLLDAAEMEKEKAVIVNEIRSVDDSPEEKGHEHYLRRMWGEHPLSRKITGEVAEVQAIDRDALAAFYDVPLPPVNLIVAVAGNFDLAEVRGLAAEALAGRGGPAGAVPAAARPRPARPPARHLVRRRPVHPGADLRGHLLPARPRPRPLLHLARLQHRLRRVDELAPVPEAARGAGALLHGVLVPHLLLRHGQWTIYANATPALAGKLLAALDGELARLLGEPLDEREIDDAKSHLVGTMILSQEDMETRMKRLVRQHTMMDRVLEFDESVPDDPLRRRGRRGAVRPHATCARTPSTCSPSAAGAWRGLRGFDFSF